MDSAYLSLGSWNSDGVVLLTLLVSSLSLFTFLDVSRKHHKTAIESTVLASVKAIYFMHQVRFGGMHDRHRFADNPRNDFSDEDATDDEELLSEFVRSLW